MTFSSRHGKFRTRYLNLNMRDKGISCMFVLPIMHALSMLLLLKRLFFDEFDPMRHAKTSDNMGYLLLYVS